MIAFAAVVTHLMFFYYLLSSKGNHRDSWGYGAADPSSGTCALMEIARVLGSMVKSGWRPRRTIVFASWAVEEYGLEGSYEYVYDNINKITNRYIEVH
jgi:Zn-dependent M28 family amino/carboxypeptidase